ncbi:MAG: polysaccharide deacetylase family protein [Hyphomicrobiaceae bacterium]
MTYLKRSLFSVVRGTHRALARRALPDRLAIYFHDLPESTWSQFSEAVGYFKALGYRFVTIDEFVSARPGDKIVWLSFDDNHAVWWRALPLFEELGVRASFFVNSGPLETVVCPKMLRAYYDRIDHHGERVPLSVSQTVDLVRAGHAIGCHSAWHYPLAELCPTRWRDEIAGSKARLEEVIGTTVKDLAFPYGMRRFFSTQLAGYCRSLGFERIAYGIPGFQHEPTVDPLRIHRTRWLFEHDLSRNVEDLCIDGRLFERLTGRSAIG